MSSNERIILPGVSDDIDRTLNHLVEQLVDRSHRNLLRSSCYDGKRAIRQVGTVIPPQYYRLGIVLGWASKAVDLLARRCNLDGFVWPDGDLESIGGTELWEANFFGAESSSAIVSSLIHGPAFLVNTRGETGEPDSLIHVRDATQATGDWNPRKRALENLISITGYDDDARISSFNLYLDGLTITAERDRGVWQWEGSEHPWGVPVEPLVYKPRVGRPFGTSRISRPVISLQDQAIREVIRAEGHMDVYSYPELWMLGADEAIFKNTDGTQKASWQVMLGRIKGIPDDPEAENPRADVKHIPASSPAPHLSWLNALAKLFARETSLPDNAVAITDVSNPTSAESYDASQYELIAESEGATDDWSPAFRRAYLRGLAIQNGLSEVPAEWHTVDSKWRNPRYLTRSAEADAGLKQLQAIPQLANTEVGLELVGLTEQQIARVQSDLRRNEGTTALATILERAANQQPVGDDNPEPAA